MRVIKHGLILFFVGSMTLLHAAMSKKYAGPPKQTSEEKHTKTIQKINTFLFEPINSQTKQLRQVFIRAAGLGYCAYLSSLLNDLSGSGKALLNKKKELNKQVIFWAYEWATEHKQENVMLLLLLHPQTKPLFSVRFANKLKTKSAAFFIHIIVDSLQKKSLDLALFILEYLEPEMLFLSEVRDVFTWIIESFFEIDYYVQVRVDMLLVLLKKWPKCLTQELLTHAQSVVSQHLTHTINKIRAGQREGLDMQKAELLAHFLSHTIDVYRANLVS